jgi:transposase InsO family protein
VQYASRPFRKLLKTHGIKGSMSRKGDCWDNAVVESFFGTLKSERVHWRSYQTREEARADIVEYITMFYNSRRLHSYLGYQSPDDFERNGQIRPPDRCRTGVRCELAYTVLVFVVEFKRLPRESSIN